MQTKQAIQTSANVIRITSISVGDVYKRFDEQYDDRVYYGLVTGVHNDGEKTVIEATEYRYTYWKLEVDYRILRGEKDYILFPSSPEELNLQLDTARVKLLKENEEAEEKIEKNKKLVIEIDQLISGETQKKLKSMDYRELTQSEYNEKKLALN